MIKRLQLLNLTAVGYITVISAIKNLYQIQLRGDLLSHMELNSNEFLSKSRLAHDFLTTITGQKLNTCSNR
jgi:hypothetical protein